MQYIDSIASRFDILQQRYERFISAAAAEGGGYNAWVDSVKAAEQEESDDKKKASITLECLTKAVLFPKEEEEIENWTFTIACMAMRKFLEVYVPSARMSVCGKALWIEDVQHIATAETPPRPTTATASPPRGGDAYLAMRNAVLEVRVLELESKLKGAKTTTTPASSGSTTTTWTIPTSEADVHAFLMEKRYEAEDAIHRLKSTLQNASTEEHKRQREERRAQGKQARRAGAAAEDEIARLQAEIELMRSSLVRTGVKAPTEDLAPILPRRALTMAGFRNMQPNDVLTITPLLVDEFELEVGPALHQPGVHVCFPAKDRDKLLKIVTRMMGIHLPHIACTP